MKIKSLKMSWSAPSQLSVAIWHRLAILACAATALAAIDRVSGQDVVINGGFEDPGGNGMTPTGWTKDFNSFGTYSGAAHSESWGLHVGNNANSGGEYQDIMTTAGASYSVSLYVENFGAAAGTSHVDVLIGTPGDGTFSFGLPNDVNGTNAITMAYASGVTNSNFVVGSATNGGWQQVTFEFTANGPLTRLGIYNSWKTNDTVHSINVDDVSVIPATLVNVTLAAVKRFDNPGADLVVTAAIPSSANQAHAVSLTVSNDNPVAVSLQGAVNNVITVNFAAGATNVQSFVVHVNAFGNATLTASGSVIVTSTITVGGLPPRTLVEAFRASSTSNLNYGTVPNDGDALSTWAGDINNSTVAQQFASELPIFRVLATPSGSAAIGFTNQGVLFIPGDVSPMGGRTNFSIAIVFRSYTNGNAAGQQWYYQTGILDAEEGGVQNDWGISLDSNGVLNFGIGSPDYTFPDGNNTVADSAWHIAVFASEETSQQLRINLDDLPTSVSAGANVSRAPRDPANILLGKSYDFANYFLGDIAEIRFYDGALTTVEVTNLIHSLKTNYNILFASEANLFLSATNPFAGPGSDITVTVAIPLGKNSFQPVTVTVTSDNTNVVTLNGRSSLVLTYPTGGTNVQSLSAHIQGLGSANLTAESPGLAPATLVLFGQATLHSLNVVVNGGFESPGGNGVDPTGWTKDSVNNFNSYGTYSGAAHSGLWGLHTGGGANTGGRYQDITMTA
ncbi:MAG: hypothetical protein NT154_14370, partial [Verrucomicrobia bacterium]|nr:hypothetical protein [Verrucomicrobiota bacterium]